MSLEKYLRKELSQTEIQNRILKLDRFELSPEGIKKLGKGTFRIDILIKAIQSLMAAEKLIPENGLATFKVNKNKEISASKFLNNLRKIHETGRLD